MADTCQRLRKALLDEAAASTEYGALAEAVKGGSDGAFRELAALVVEAVRRDEEQHRQWLRLIYDTLCRSEPEG